MAKAVFALILAYTEALACWFGLPLVPASRLG
jgi:hypothetical protein